MCILLTLLLLQLNEITPYMDGGLVYGIAKGWADVLRLDHNGRLAPNGQLAEHDKVSERCNVNRGDFYIYGETLWRENTIVY